MTLQDIIFFGTILLPIFGAIIGGILGYKRILFKQIQKKHRIAFMLLGILVGGVIGTILIIVIVEISGGSF